MNRFRWAVVVLIAIAFAVAEDLVVVTYVRSTRG